MSTIIKLMSVSPRNEAPKSYKVASGILFIDNDPIEIVDDASIASWDTGGLEDFESIERDEDDNIVIKLKVFTTSKVIEDFFSVEEINGKISDAKFPYQVIDKEIKWENNIEAFEGMEW